MDMEIRVGDRFRPLENNKQYGPKSWRLEVDEKGKRTWIEIAMTEAEKAFDRMRNGLMWDSHPTMFRTPPITPADAEKEPGLKSYIDGFAVFPKVENIIGKGTEKEAQRRAQEDAWMARYADMESKQTIILPPEKPADDATTGKYFRELKRGN